MVLKGENDSAASTSISGYVKHVAEGDLPSKDTINFGVTGGIEDNKDCFATISHGTGRPGGTTLGQLSAD